MKKIEKRCDLQFEKTYFFYCSFLAGSLALCFKDDFYNLKKRIFFDALFQLVLRLCVLKIFFTIRKNVFSLLLFFGWLFGFVFQRRIS
jgi:hypothetical protein